MIQLPQVPRTLLSLVTARAWIKSPSPLSFPRVEDADGAAASPPGVAPTRCGRMWCPHALLLSLIGTTIGRPIWWVPLRLVAMIRINTGKVGALVVLAPLLLHPIFPTGGVLMIVD